MIKERHRSPVCKLGATRTRKNGQKDDENSAEHLIAEMNQHARSEIFPVGRETSAGSCRQMGSRPITAMLVRRYHISKKFCQILYHSQAGVQIANITINPDSRIHD
jgi:hypothetical protein